MLPNPKLGPRTATFNPEDAVDKYVPAPRGPAKKDEDRERRLVDPVTPVTARLFAMWTLTSSLIRCYTAYHIDQAPLYDLTMWTYAIAFSHYAMEYFVFQTMTFGLPQFMPMTFPVIGLVWMTAMRSFYLEGY